MTNKNFDISKISDVFPNTFKSSNWQVVFSNMPSVENFKDMRYFTNMVKSVTLPDYSLPIFKSEIQGWTMRHPEAPKPNQNLSDLLITFRMSEDMKNYLILLDFTRQIRYGQINDEILREYTIKQIMVNLLDNQARPIATIGFTNAFLTNLSSVNLDMGQASEMDFSCTFSYEEIIYKTIATAC